MIVSHRHRFIFLHIPKTGGEAIADALLPVLGPKDIFLMSASDIWLRTLRSPHYRRLNGLRKHSRLRQVRAAVGEQVWQEYYKFTFVREPVDRMHSFYRYVATIDARREQISPRHLWLYLTPTGRKSDPRRWAATEVFRRTNSFSEFLQPPDGQANRLMAPQVNFTNLGSKPALDFIGRFENLGDGLAEVSSTLGLGPLRLSHRNASAPPASLRPEQFEITAADRAFLEAHYAADYKAFGYPTTSV